MNDVVPRLDTAAIQLTDIEKAISEKNYSALQSLLLHQAVTLHTVGMDFLEKSEEVTKLQYKKTCIDIALRAFAQSQKCMSAIKTQ